MHLNKSSSHSLITYNFLINSTWREYIFDSSRHKRKRKEKAFGLLKFFTWNISTSFHCSKQFQARQNSQNETTKKASQVKNQVNFLRMEWVKDEIPSIYYSNGPSFETEMFREGWKFRVDISLALLVNDSQLKVFLPHFQFTRSLT